MWVDHDTQMHGHQSSGDSIMVEQAYNPLRMMDPGTDENHFIKSNLSSVDSPTPASSSIPRSRSSSPSADEDSTTDMKCDDRTGDITSDSSILDITESGNTVESKEMSSNDNIFKISNQGESNEVGHDYINMTDEFVNDQAYLDMELNSSPIKGTSTKAYRNETSSSPIKKKKSVAFSDDLISELPSSPGSVVPSDKLMAPEQTPKKSILKINPMNHTISPCNPNDTALWMKPSNKIQNGNTPSNPKFWISGTVIQLAPNSSDLPQLIEGCITVLKDKNFNKKFEVYATLNHICKSNSSECLLRLLTIQNKRKADPHPNNTPAKNQLKGHSPFSMESTYIHDLSVFIQRDVTMIESKLFLNHEDKENNISPSKNDPFGIRIISQALKLINMLMLDHELNNFISIDDAKWFYLHSCSMIVKPTISKTLIIPYLSILKDCKFNSKKKKQIFDNNNDNTNISEQILQSLLNMRKFVSSSLVVEEFVTLKNLVSNFPAMMANNFNHWFEYFLINLCDFSSPLYSKIIAMGISVLLEVARNYLDNKNVLLSVRKLLSSPMSSEIKSISSQNNISAESLPSSSTDTLIIDFIISSLESLIHSGHYKSAMDIWVGITLLTNDSSSGYESWQYLSKWLKVHKTCFNVQDNSAKVIALNSWKAIVFNVCHNDLDNMRYIVDSASNNKGKGKSQVLNNILRPKLKLLMHTLLNITSLESQREIIDSLHNLFLSIIYTLLNPIFINSTTKYFHIYWDKIIQPVLINFYFKKDLSNAYMHQLGLKILTRLLKTTMPINEKAFNEMRCLSNDPVNLNEINSIPPKWVFSRFDRIMQNINIIFQSDKLNIDSKLEFFNSFLYNLRMITKKEIKTSDATFDIIDNIPNVLTVLLKYNKLSFDSIHKLIVNLNDAFGATNLMNKPISTGEFTNNIYIWILKDFLCDSEVLQANEILGLIYTSIDESKNLLFLIDLIKLQTQNNNTELKKFYVSILSKKRINTSSNVELELAGKLFQLISEDYEIIAKKLIQDVVLLDAEEFERTLNILNIQMWKLPVFKYFIELVHDAPHNHLKQIPLNLIIIKWEDTETFFDLIEFLINKKFDHELYNLRRNIMKKCNALEGFKQFEFRSLWKSYLESILSTGNHKLLDELLVSSYEGGIDVKPLILNKWEILPLLKGVWLRDNSVLYIDKELLEEMKDDEPQPCDKSRSLKSETYIPEYDLHSTKNDVNVNKRVLRTREAPTSTKEDYPDQVANQGAFSNEQKSHEDDANTETNGFKETNTPAKGRPNRKKAKSPIGKSKGKKKSNSKVKKEKDQSSELDSNFDIHSFTAMLNAKLSPTTAAKKSKQINSKVVSIKSKQDTISQSRIDNSSHTVNDEPKALVKSEIQIASSLDKEQDNLESKNSVPSQNSTSQFSDADDTISSPINDSKDHINSESIPYDYSEMIESGFSETEIPEYSNNGDISNDYDEQSDNLKRKMDEEAESPILNKKQKVPKEEHNGSVSKVPENIITPSDSKEKLADNSNEAYLNISINAEGMESPNHEQFSIPSLNEANDIDLPLDNQDPKFFYDGNDTSDIDQSDGQLPEASDNSTQGNATFDGKGAYPNQLEESSSTTEEAGDTLCSSQIAGHTQQGAEQSSTSMDKSPNDKEENIGNKVSTIINGISENQMSNMSLQEKYQLETTMMMFILRMRNATPENK